MTEPLAILGPIATTGTRSALSGSVKPTKKAAAKLVRAIRKAAGPDCGWLELHPGFEVHALRLEYARTYNYNEVWVCRTGDSPSQAFFRGSAEDAATEILFQAWNDSYRLYKTVDGVTGEREETQYADSLADGMAIDTCYVTGGDESGCLYVRRVA